MKVLETPLPGLCVVENDAFVDTRGRFDRIFRDSDWTALRPGLRFVQVNLSTTTHEGVVRGMHFQRPPVAEAKLIRCLHGRAYDVAVDLRAGSPTFLHWHAVELAADEARAVFIPEGFAHGFQAMSDDTRLLYLHTAEWAPASEGGVSHDDPRLGIAWPLAVRGLSERDRGHPPITEDFKAIAV